MALYDDIKELTDAYLGSEKKRVFGKVGRGKRNQTFLLAMEAIIAEDSEMKSGDERFTISPDINGSGGSVSHYYLNDSTNTYSHCYDCAGKPASVLFYDVTLGKKLSLSVGFPSMVLDIHPVLTVKEEPLHDANISEWMQHVRDNKGTAGFTLSINQPELPMSDVIVPKTYKGQFPLV